MQLCTRGSLQTSSKIEETHIRLQIESQVRLLNDGHHNLRGMRGRWGTLVRFYLSRLWQCIVCYVWGRISREVSIWKNYIRCSRISAEHSNYKTIWNIWVINALAPILSRVYAYAKVPRQVHFSNSRRNGAWHHDKNGKYLNKYIVFFFVSIFFSEIFLAREVGYTILLIQLMVGDSSISRACWYFAFKYANATSNWNFIHAIEAGILVWVWAHVQNGSWKCSITYNLMLICRASQ